MNFDGASFLIASSHSTASAALCFLSTRCTTLMLSWWSPKRNFQRAVKAFAGPAVYLNASWSARAVKRVVLIEKRNNRTDDRIANYWRCVVVRCCFFCDKK